MPSVLFWTCEECGIEWKADLDANGRRSIYICNCGRRHEVDGTVIGLHCIPHVRGSQAMIWKEAPAAKHLIQIYSARGRADRSQNVD